METDELARLIKSRRSIRAWQKKAVPEELLLKAVEIATWAPNGGNFQNWHFYVVQNRDTINALADAVQASANIIADWPEAGRFPDSQKSLRERSSFFRNASAVIVVTAAEFQSQVDKILALREEADPIASRIRGWRRLADSRIQSVASAIAYLLLVLHQMGLGAVWITGPIQAKEAIERILKVPQGADAVAFIPVGYPAEQPQSKGRKPVQEVCEVIR